MKANITITIICSLVCLLPSCQPDFLDIKRDKKQVIPNTLQDYQAIMDNMKMNSSTIYSAGELGADDFFVSTEQWNLAFYIWEKNAYVWADDIFEGEQGAIWDTAYEKILYANLTMEGLNKLNASSNDQTTFSRVQGTALFFRAYTYFQLAQTFCKVYNPVYAETALGIPLKISADINEKVSRSTLAETYRFIIKDLMQAQDLLPPLDEKFKNRPSKNVTLALLARIHLQMGNYEEAQTYAEGALAMNSNLLDYRNVTPATFYAFPLYGRDNPEVLLIDQMYSCSLLGSSRLQVNPLLLQRYHEGDLRKKLFFIENNGITTFRGTYNGNIMFSGAPTTSEVLLISAECYARLGRMQEAWDALRLLWQHRYEEAFMPSANLGDHEGILTTVLEERRKELVFRGVRWFDIQRFNREGAGLILSREIGETTYEIQPNDKRYTWPIPDNEIRLSGLEQNDR